MKILPIAIFMLVIFGCSKSENEKSTSLESIEEEYIEVMDIPPKYIVEFESQECKTQLKNAQEDVERGKLVYRTNSNDLIRYSDEMEALLETYGIKYENFGPKCVPTLECYRYYMDSVIFSRFGDSFITTLEKKADSIFLASWQTKVYEYWSLDSIPKYSEGNGFADIFIENRISFPEKWDSIASPYEREYFLIIVEISNTGNLVDWKIESYNLKDTNEQFLSYLKRDVNRIVSKMESWKPGILKNRKVASEYYIDVDLDKRIY